ncbi:hypothetical protein [Novosphingobium naphthalenivorans]|uniref:hypothetical protein n=1 Tax=Novosphingobium naphthalenivorans TaxID=273168 RepID=UPI000B2738F6|nr:hypothetical protein [Novosphingobium naphthalenivorans]
MIDIAKYDFPQEAPAHPFKTVKLSELKRALLAKHLHGKIPNILPRKKIRDPFSGRFVWARRAQHPMLRRAEQWCSAQILSDLRAGKLTAFVPANSNGVYCRIEPPFWQDQFAGLSVGRSLLHFDDGKSVPGELLGKTVYVFEECALEWLAERQIGENNPAFPAVLRGTAMPQKVPKALGRPPSRIEKWCVDTGLEILAERGGISPNFKQTHLIQQIYARRPENWSDEEPSDSSMKRYARKAIKLFDGKG